MKRSVHNSSRKVIPALDRKYPCSALALNGHFFRLVMKYTDEPNGVAYYYFVQYKTQVYIVIKFISYNRGLLTPLIIKVDK